MKLGTLLLVISCFPLGALGLPEISNATLSPQSAFNKQFFRKTNTHLSSEEFEAKWETVMQSTAESLLHSFVPTYYADLKHLGSLGPIGICFGDLHSDNFRFISTEGTEYAYEDLDDTGFCPISLDVLRYVVSLQLEERSRSLIKRVIREYVAVVDGQSPVRLPHSLYPDLEKERLKEVKENTKNGKFKFGAGIDPVSAEEKTLVKNTFKTTPKLSGLRVLDTAEYTKEDGGSAGLLRYWVLVEDAEGDEDIIELKRQIQPATAIGNWGVTPSPRIDWAVKKLWKGIPFYYFELPVQKIDFLVRSRAKKGFKLEKLSEEDLELVLKAQVGLVALHHREYLRESPILNELAEWLEVSSEFLSARYRNVLH